MVITFLCQEPLHNIMLKHFTKIFRIFLRFVDHSQPFNSPPIHRKPWPLSRAPVLEAQEKKNNSRDNTLPAMTKSLRDQILLRTTVAFLTIIYKWFCVCLPLFSSLRHAHWPWLGPSDECVHGRTTGGAPFIQGRLARAVLSFTREPGFIHGIWRGRCSGTLRCLLGQWW